MTREAIVRLFAERQQKFTDRDAAGVAAFHAADGVIDSPMAGVVHGREAITRVYDTWLKGFPDLVVSQRDLLIDGDRVIQVMQLEGTDTGGFMGLPATNKPFRMTVVFRCEMKDGAIAQCRTVYDYTGLLIQIGLVKAKPA